MVEPLYYEHICPKSFTEVSKAHGIVWYQKWCPYNAIHSTFPSIAFVYMGHAGQRSHVWWIINCSCKTITFFCSIHSSCLWLWGATQCAGDNSLRLSGWIHHVHSSGHHWRFFSREERDLPGYSWDSEQQWHHQHSATAAGNLGWWKWCLAIAYIRLWPVYPLPNHVVLPPWNVMAWFPFTTWEVGPPTMYIHNTAEKQWPHIMKLILDSRMIIYYGQKCNSYF